MRSRFHVVQAKADNPMREIVVDKLVLNISVGQSGDRLTFASRVLEQLTGQKPCLGRGKFFTTKRWCGGGRHPDMLQCVRNALLYCKQSSLVTVVIAGTLLLCTCFSRLHIDKKSSVSFIDVQPGTPSVSSASVGMRLSPPT